jgi:hypothetical protein
MGIHQGCYYGPDESERSKMMGQMRKLVDPVANIDVGLLMPQNLPILDLPL